MKTGLSTVCLQKNTETENALSEISKTRADVCEVYLQTFYEYRPEFARKYAVNTEVFDVHVNPQNFEAQLFSPSRRIRGDGFYWLDQILRSAQLFGSRNFVLHGFARGGGADDFNALAGYINEITEFCGRYGINANLETVSFGLYNRPSVFSELKSRCPALTGALDLKQAYLSGYPYTMYLKDMSGAISLVHLTDVDERGVFCLPGRGKTDFAELFKRLKGEGFDGAAIIDAPANDAAELENSLEYINDIIYRVT